MGTIKSLYNQEAVEKIREIAEEKICLFCTNHNNEIASRPMSTAGIDDDGTIWFFSQKDSEKNQQLQSENKVYLMYIDQDKHHYLSLTGAAEVVEDQKKSGRIMEWFPECMVRRRERRSPGILDKGHTGRRTLLGYQKRKTSNIDKDCDGCRYRQPW